MIDWKDIRSPSPDPGDDMVRFGLALLGIAGVYLLLAWLMGWEP